MATWQGRALDPRRQARRKPGPLFLAALLVLGVGCAAGPQNPSPGQGVQEPGRGTAPAGPSGVGAAGDASPAGSTAVEPGGMPTAAAGAAGGGADQRSAAAGTGTAAHDPEPGLPPDSRPGSESTDPGKGDGGQRESGDGGLESKPPPEKPEPGQAEYEQARRLMAAGERFRAIGRLRAALAENPSLAEAWNDLARALLPHEPHDHVQPPGRPGRYQEAVDAAKEALALRPGWDEATYTLGLVLLADGRYEDALVPLRAAANQFPDRPEVQTALGLALIGSGRPEEAIPICRRADGLQAEFVLAERCLEEAGDGFRRLPATEAAVGGYHYDPQEGFRWTGPPRENGGAFVRVSPPWTCGLHHPDGFRTLFLGCHDPEPFVYSWSFSRPEAGTTPAGIGIGTPWEQVLETYGTTYQERDGTLHYVVADLHMGIFGSEETGVLSLWFSRPTPYFAVDSLVHGRTQAPPLGWGDAGVEGIYILRTTREEAEAILGPGELEANPWVEVRTYRDGQVRLVIQDDGVVSDVEVEGAGVTPRGVAIGDSAFLVRRRYGQPDRERPGELVYAAYTGEKWPTFLLTFYLQSGKVRAISLKAGR